MSATPDHEFVDAREVLEAVAAGEIDPADAAALLAAFEAGSGGTEARVRVAAEVRDDADDADGDDPAPGDAPRRVVVRVGAGAVRVVSDPSVAAVEVSGPHSISQEDGATVVEVQPLVAELPDDEPSRFVITSGRGRRFGFRARHHGDVEVRVAPRVDLVVDVGAGAATVRDHIGHLTCIVSAGAIKVTGLDGTLGGTVSAGALKVVGRIHGGDEEVRVEAGSFQLGLRPDSDVTVDGEVSLGSMQVQGGGSTMTVGDGAGRLHVIGNLSSVKVACLQGAQA